MDSLPPLDQLTPQEKDALILALWAEIQELRTRNAQLEARVALLEAKLKQPAKNSKNSSIPPSKSPKSNTSAPNTQKKRREASVGRAGGGRPLHPDPDHTIIARAKICPHCTQPIEEKDLYLYAAYDKIEIPKVKPIVTRVEQYGGECACCGESFVSPVPVGMENGTPYGASVDSLATYLRYTHAISYNRMSGLLKEVFGLPISEGALSNLFYRVKGRLDPRVQEILTRLRSSRLVCSDETSARVNGRNQWEWVFQNEEVCIHVIRPSRGQGVIQEVFAEHQPEIWVSDLYSAQKNNPASRWQACLAHQVRDCEFAVEAGDTVFAPRMKTLLLRAIAIHKRRQKLSESTLYQYRCDIRRRLESCLALEPTNKHGVRLKKRYSKLKENLFLFLEDATIPPTNNSSEQAIRMSTVFRKVTNCFRSDWGKDLFAAVRSVVNTGKRQGLSAYEAIRKALSPLDSFFGRAEDAIEESGLDRGS